MDILFVLYHTVKIFIYNVSKLPDSFSFEREGKNDIPSTEFNFPPLISTIVGAKSMLATTSLLTLFNLSPGPRTKRGTRISET